MPAIDDFCETIRSWTNRKSWDNALITSWRRMAEQDLNTQLRIKDMIQIDTATITEGRVTLPADWLDLDFVTYQDVGGDIRFKPRADFYRDKKHNGGYYTISGNFVSFGDPIDEVEGLKVELHYYGNVPPLGANLTWLDTLYPSLPLMATLSYAMIYGIEDERVAVFVGGLGAAITTLNENHLKSKASGSRLNRPAVRSYG